MPEVSLKAVQRLLRRYGGEVAVLEHLYDRVEKLAAQPGGHLIEEDWLR